jgi:predicted HAD superfamily hydrolase
MINLCSGFEELKKNINGASIISFDIFDTLLLRDFYYPIDVFKYIEESYGIKDFQKRRVAAEIECRNTTDNEEIEYKDIYKILSDIDPEIELSVELECCLLNPEIKKQYNFALEQEKKIIAISDMYLDESFIQKLLEKCGYHNIYKIYVSSRYGKRKSTGSLYKYVLSDLEIDASDVLHIGDNFKSDYLNAKNMGIIAFHCKSKRDQLKHNKSGSALQKLRSLNHSYSSVYTALIANQYEDEKINEYWKHFGFEYSGIVVYLFIRWVFEYCEKNELSRVYFMARDGEIMKKVFDCLYADKPIKSYYLEGSRRTYLLPSMDRLDENSLEYLTTGDPDTNLRSFITRLELSELESRAELYFTNLDIKISNHKGRRDLKEFFKLNEKYIISEAKRERKNLRSYLSKINFFLDDAKAIIDVGWNATSQKYLEKTFNIDVHGLYFGTKKGVNPYLNGMYMHNGLPIQKLKLMKPNAEIIELLFCGTHASVLHINEQGNPVYFTTTIEEQNRIDNAKQIHEGVLGFVTQYHDLVKKYKLTVNIELVDNVIDNLVLTPSLMDIENIGNISYATGFGNSEYKKIIHSFDINYRQFFINMLMKKNTNSNYWQAGWKEYHRLNNSKYMFIMLKLIWINGKIKRCRFNGFKICLQKVSNRLGI